MKFEDKLAEDMMYAWLAIELVGCGFPIRCPEDLKGLQYAVAQTEISVVTCDEKKIVALDRAIDVFITKFAKCRDELIQAALVLALALQVAAKNTLAAIKGEMHLEMLS